ncbi:MAG: mechanosensitive ion channel family protein [Proteobacteria bacterium]|nr:mechanosensitive ion channel family protein [Pseudomonadota bacterium]
MKRHASSCPNLSPWPICRLLHRLLCWLLAAWLMLPGMPAAQAQVQVQPVGFNAAAAPAAADDKASENGAPLPQVDALRKQLDAMPLKPGDLEEGRRLLTDVNAIAQAAERVIALRAGELAELDRRLEGLGPAPESGNPAEAPDVAQQRKLLDRQRASIDSELKLARLVAVDAEQRGADLVRQRRALFRAALTTRSDSPLGPSFWRNLRNAAPRDLVRLRALGTDLTTSISAALQSPQRGAFWTYLALALLLAVAGPWLAERVLLRVLPARLPAARLRRTLLAAVAVVTHVFIVATALQLTWNAVQLGGPLSDELLALRQASLRAVIYASFVIALGHALLSRRHPSWRLLAIRDELARSLSPFPWWIATLSALGALVTELNVIVGASLSAEVFIHALFALLLSVTVAKALGHLRTAPATPAADAAQRTDERPLWVGLILAGAGLAVAAAVLAMALGYIALAGTLARQMVWSGVVFACTYLLMQLGDDLCDALLSSKGRVGAHIHDTLGLDAQLLDQAAVLVSGVLRLVLFFYMVVALMAPLGTDPDELLHRGSSLNHSLQIGDITIAPQALLTALAVVCAGFLGIRLLKHWLAERYFPHTSLEPGMRVSIVTLLGYVGAVVVVAVALAGLGISVERIAWVASALTVGIGFGLQAIVQNFISGLILLAEQPVKVGDWVVLGDTEGDVRRVNVRATEIQLGDKSTVIVPNSEFITKTVRNMTLGSAQGRVLLRLPAPLDTDARRMRELILQAFYAHQGILDSPAPSVTLEGIQSGTLTFLAIGYVSSPRQAAGVRSEVLFAILEALRAAGLTLSPPATTTVAQPQGEPAQERS